MEKDAVTRSWVTTNLQISPASLPPSWSPQQGGDNAQLHFTSDTHYLMHGEIIAFTAITIFAIFLLFLIVPFIRRATGSKSAAAAAEEYSGSGRRNRCLLLMLGRERYEQQEEASDHEKNYDHGIHQHSNS